MNLNNFLDFETKVYFCTTLVNMKLHDHTIFWWYSVADLGGDGGCIPPTNLKLTISAEKSVFISKNQSPFPGASPHQLKP